MKHNDLAASSDNALANLVPDVVRLSRYLARDRDRADDLAQEVLLNVWSRMANGANIEDLRPYVMASLRNRMRRRPRQTEQLLESDMPTTPPEAPARLAAKDVLASIAKLPREQGRLLIEFAEDGSSYADLARRHGLPIGTVMSRIARARARLCVDLDLPSDHPVESLVERAD